MARRQKSKRKRIRKGRVKPNLVGDIVGAAKGVAGTVSGAVSSGVHGAAEFGGQVMESTGKFLETGEQVVKEAAPIVGTALAAGAAYLLAGKGGTGGGGGDGRQRPMCPPGYYLARDGRCYPTRGRSLSSMIPMGPARPPTFAVSVPGRVTAPSVDAFGSALKSAAPGVTKGEGRVNPDKMTIEGISFVSRHMAKVAKRRMNRKK